MRPVLAFLCWETFCYYLVSLCGAELLGMLICSVHACLGIYPFLLETAIIFFFFVIQIYKLFPKGPLNVTAIYFSAFVFIFNFISWYLLFSYLVWLGVSQFCLFSLKKQSRFPGSFYSFIFQFHYCPSYLYFFCIVHLGLLILSLIP